MAFFLIHAYMERNMASATYIAEIAIVIYLQKYFTKLSTTRINIISSPSYHIRKTL